jgi:hypothetical protein
MLFDLAAPYTTLCLAGMCKNAGKTTALNALIGGARARGVSLALTSIGRDGEREDLVTGTHKPPIYVTGGALFATARGLLPKCDVTGEILDMTGIHTPLGEVLILRALSDGFVELAGPSMTEQIVALTEKLKSFGAQKVLIDGALFRRSLCAPEAAEGVILSTGASYGPDMGKTAADTAFVAQLLTLPVSGPWPDMAGRRFARDQLYDDLAEALAGQGDILYATGAFTDAMATLLLRRRAIPREIAVEDGTRLLLSRENYEKLRARGVSFRVRRQNDLVAVTVNPFSAYGAPYDPDAFQGLVAEKVSVPVVNVWKESQWN